MNSIEQADAAIKKAKFGSPEYEIACKAKIKAEYEWPGPYSTSPRKKVKDEK